MGFAALWILSAQNQFRTIGENWVDVCSSVVVTGLRSVSRHLSDLFPCQDESNRSGGKWIIRLRKGLASRFWENIILAMLGEQFMVGEEICGAVVSIRFQVFHYYHSCCTTRTTFGPQKCCCTENTSWRTVASSLTHTWTTSCSCFCSFQLTS